MNVVPEGISHGDAVVDHAWTYGGTVVTRPTELFWGDRVSRFSDPFGDLWWAHQRVADPAFGEAMDYVQSAEFTSVR